MAYIGESEIKALGWLLAIGIIVNLGGTTAVSLESREEVVETVASPQETAVVVAVPARVKRSRDVQQLCGYRLLDALRSVCDRNFQGFARRSDPTFFQNGKILSGEDGGIFTSDFGLNPWEPNTEYPSMSRDDTTSPTSEDSNFLDYLEMLQPSKPRSQGSSKAFALKMLSEPPNTHQRFRRNIIDECCKKPCAMGQMLKYCAITGVGKRTV